MNEDTPPDFDADAAVVTLTAADGARAEIHRHGAHVTSWVPANGDERLFLSRTADYGPRASIRGGIPVVFPQFSNFGPLPKHGFARVAQWYLAGIETTPDGDAQATLTLHESDETLALWPHRFAATLAVRVGGQSLAVSLSIRNSGDAALSFTAALHNYLAVADIAQARVHGLQNLRYRDTAAGGDEREERAAELAIEGEVDRIYLDAPQTVLMQEPKRRLSIARTGFAEVVVWNPGTVKGAALADLEPGGDARMLCIESGAITRPIQLAPGAIWSGAQKFIAA